jgi:molybdopterin-binding protein
LRSAAARRPRTCGSIGNGVIVTSSITNEAVDELGLKVGDDAIAVIKASDVMVATP